MGSPTAEVVVAAKRRGSGAFKSFDADLRKIATTAGVVGAAAAAALTVVTKRAFENIDALAKTADAISVTTESLAGLQLAAQITGVGQEQLNKALLRQQKTIFDAQQGLTTATRALDILGLKVEDLLGLSADEQFIAISEAMGKVENATLRSGAAAQIFGARNVAVLKTLDLGREGLEAYAAEADRVGIAVSRVDAAKIEQANDAMLLARQRVQGIGNVIAVQLAPVVTGLAQAFHEAGGGAEEMGRRVRRVIDGIAVGVGIVGDAYHGWRLIFGVVEIAALTMARNVTRSLADLQEFTRDTINQLREITPFIDPIANPNPAGLRVLTESLALSAEDAQKQLDALIAAQKPSEKIAEALANARYEAQQLAEAAGQDAAGRIAVAGADTGETEEARRAREAAEAAAAQQRQQLERELESTRQFTLTREQVEIEATTRRLDILRTAYEQQLIDQERFNELTAEVARRGSEKLTEIALEGLSEREKFERQSAIQKTQSVLGGLVDMTAGVAQHNRKLFELNKAAAVANAIVNGISGVARTLEAYPFPINIGMAAAHAAAAAAQVQAIRSTSSQGGGGGTTPSAAATPVVNNQPVQSSSPIRDVREDREPQVIINITGITGSIDQETALRIGEALNEVIDERSFAFRAGS